MADQYFIGGKTYADGTYDIIGTLDYDLYQTERYGEFILMEPDFHSRAWFVWAFPVLALLSGFAGLSLLLQRRKIQTPSVAASAVVADTADFIRRIEKLGP